jgi:hypothetical protein
MHITNLVQQIVLIIVCAVGFKELTQKDVEVVDGFCLQQNSSAT